MINKLEHARKALTDKHAEQVRLETVYRKFLVDIYGRVYQGMQGNLRHIQDEKQQAEYRRAWQTVQDEMRELTWLIADFETLEPLEK